MTTRLTLIDQMANDLRTTLTVTNPAYQTKIWEVRVGVYDPEEFSSLPSIGIWMLDDDPIDDFMDDTIFRDMSMVVYGHVDAEAMNSYINFYKLIEDIENFLYNTDNTVYQNTILGKLVTDYGGASEQMATFVYNFSLRYSQSGLES